MQTNAQVASNIKNNLADERMQGICLFIDSFIKRNKPEIGIPVYRIKNKTTGNFITSIAEFIAAVSGDALKQEYPFQGERASGDRVTGYNVTLTNLELTFNIHSKEDEFFTNHYNYFADYDRPYQFSLYMAYVNDADTALPVKISSIRLVTV